MDGQRWDMAWFKASIARQAIASQSAEGAQDPAGKNIDHESNVTMPCQLET